MQQVKTGKSCHLVQLTVCLEKALKTVVLTFHTQLKTSQTQFKNKNRPENMACQNYFALIYNCFIFLLIFHFLVNDVFGNSNGKYNMYW